MSIPGGREGFRPLNNWDNIGQRLTDSGGVELDNVRAYARRVLAGQHALGA